MEKAAELSSSLEDYLEAIYNIIQEKQAVRAKDIAARLKVSNASVTGALKTLAKKRFLNYAPYDVISLTPEGEKIAREIARRHRVLKDFLEKVLNIDPETADKTACQLEHGISPEVIDRLVKFIEFIEICPLGGQKLMEGFKRHLECGLDTSGCSQCIELAQRSRSGLDSADQKTATLDKLDIGQRAIIKKIRSSPETRKRLMGMGLTPGAMVRVERTAPMGDPIEVDVRGYRLTLRREEARKVEVEVR